jgi:hypothetical protein
MKLDVTRPGAGFDGRERRVIRRERAILLVEPVHEHFVDPEIGDEREPVARIHDDRMGERACLTLRIHTAPGVLREPGAVTQRTVRVDRQGGDIATLIVGDQRVVVGLVERDVTRIGAAGRFLVEQSQLAGLRVDLIRADGPGRLA